MESSTPEERANANGAGRRRSSDSDSPREMLFGSSHRLPKRARRSRRWRSPAVREPFGARSLREQHRLVRLRAGHCPVDRSIGQACEEVSQLDPPSRRDRRCMRPAPLRCAAIDPVRVLLEQDVARHAHLLGGAGMKTRIESSETNLSPRPGPAQVENGRFMPGATGRTSERRNLTVRSAIPLESASPKVIGEASGATAPSRRRLVRSISSTERGGAISIVAVAFRGVPAIDGLRTEIEPCGDRRLDFRDRHLDRLLPHERRYGRRRPGTVLHERKSGSGPVPSRSWQYVEGVDPADAVVAKSTP